MRVRKLGTGSNRHHYTRTVAYGDIVACGSGTSAQGDRGVVVTILHEREPHSASWFSLQPDTHEVQISETELRLMVVALGYILTKNKG